jgi:hypothetical protein
MKMQKITSDPSYSLQNGARVMFLIFLISKPKTLYSLLQTLRNLSWSCSICEGVFVQIIVDQVYDFML